MKKRKIVSIIIITILIIGCFLIVYYFINSKNKSRSLSQNKKSNISNVTVFNDVFDLNSNILESTDNAVIQDDILIENSKQNNYEEYKKSSWRIEIPKINLIAKIEDGVSKEVLREAVGHFQSSSVVNGNVCLAAHNRGYLYNFFERLNELQPKDIIKYYYDGNLYEYVVQDVKVISENNVTGLQDKSNNVLTLYTCVKNQPESRLCVISTIK